MRYHQNQMGDSTHSPSANETNNILLERLKESPLHKLTKKIEQNSSNILSSYAPDKHVD